MRGSIKLANIAGISINVHITFLILMVVFLGFGLEWLILLAGIFFFVTLHELAHSLVAQKFGIKVKEITLLPIGGVASMTKIPEKPYQEFFISLAGPAFNIAVVVIFFVPLYLVLGQRELLGTLDYMLYYFLRFHIMPPSLQLLGQPSIMAHVYWINLILAVFNLIPAFPMDGGRVLRAMLAQRMNYQRATRIAVNFGHIFALIFGYLGFVRMNFWWIAIAIFIYMAASSEELQVDIKTTLKRFKIKDIMSAQFLKLEKGTVLSKVLELIFHSHQEDFPVMEENTLVGFVTRADIIRAVHEKGTDVLISNIMRTDFPSLYENDSLDKAQNIMQESSMRALPVVKKNTIIGVVTIEDVSRVYSVMSNRR